MEVLTQATELFERIQGQIREAEDIEEQSGEEAKAKIQNLKSELIEDKEIAGKIIEALEKGTLNLEERQQSEAKIRNLQKKVAEGERQIIRLVYEVEEKDKWIKELRTDIQEFKTKTQNDLTKTQNDLTKTQNDLTKTQNDLTKTQNDLTKTQNDLTKLQNDQSALRIGQLAYNFEKDLATYIYPRNTDIGSRWILTTMEEWLKKNKDTPEGREANKKWNDLKEELKVSWSPAHKNTFLKMIAFRIRVAHPSETDSNMAQSYIDKNFTDEETKCIEDIEKIHYRVNELMMK